MKCPYCQKEITRARGNLNPRSWQRAIEALLARHIKKEHKVPA